MAINGRLASAFKIIDLRFTLSAFGCMARVTILHFAEFSSNKKLSGYVKLKPELNRLAYRLFSRINQSGNCKLLFRLNPF